MADAIARRARRKRANMLFFHRQNVSNRVGLTKGAVKGSNMQIRNHPSAKRANQLFKTRGGRTSGPTEGTPVGKSGRGPGMKQKSDIDTGSEPALKKKKSALQDVDVLPKNSGVIKNSEKESDFSKKRSRVHGFKRRDDAEAAKAALSDPDLDPTSSTAAIEGTTVEIKDAFEQAENKIEDDAEAKAPPTVGDWAKAVRKQGNLTRTAELFGQGKRILTDLPDTTANAIKKKQIIGNMEKECKIHW